MGWLKESIPEDLARMMKGSQFVPMICPNQWTQTVVQAGSTTKGTNLLTLNCGTTANGSGLLYAAIRGLAANSGDNISNLSWAKKIYVYLAVQRANSDTQAVGRIQLKEVNSIGALAAKGIGISIANYVVSSESYGTQLGSTSLGVTLTDVNAAEFMIVHDPNVPSVAWYAHTGSDFVLKYTETTSAKVPSGGAGDISYLVASQANGATGTVNAYLDVANLHVWRGR